MISEQRRHTEFMKTYPTINLQNEKKRSSDSNFTFKMGSPDITIIDEKQNTYEKSSSDAGAVSNDDE